PRIGWYLFFAIVPAAALLGPIAIGSYYGMPFTGLLIGTLFFVALLAWVQYRIGFDWWMPRNELIDDLTDEDTSERSAQTFLAEEDRASQPPPKDPTAWDR
ncbi:MAG: hypothetical protein ACHQ16_07930, partial [Candidatus Lutacidiplasmatales archaeon]